MGRASMTEKITLENLVAEGGFKKRGTENTKKEIAKMRKDKDYNSITALSILHLGIKKGLLKFSTTPDKYFKKEFDYLSEHNGFDHNESQLVAVVFNCEESRIAISAIYRQMQMSYLQLRQFDRVFRSLEDKEYLYVDSKFEGIDRNQDAFDCIVTGKPYEHIDRSKEPVENLISEMKRLANFDDYNAFNKLWQSFKARYRGHILFDKIHKVVDGDFKIADKSTVTMFEQLLFLFVLQHTVENPEYISMDTINPLSEGYMYRKGIMQSFQVLINEGIQMQPNPISIMYADFFEPYLEDGMASTDKFILSSKGAKYFGVNNLGMNSSSSLNSCLTKKSESINEKELFYDEETKVQIDRLFNLLEDENFNGVQSRLRDSKMRVGFNILLYGSAGTGKTETCLQLSRVTGRDLFIVEVSDFKDKYVGESEKRIKGIFRTYNSVVEDYSKEGKKIPIMLLNEADAIIGIRKKGADNAVDKMENSVQNIILNEMENMNGVMIATTNLTENLDSAFERRFIYKVKYNRPDVSAKAKIWKSNIPSLEEDDVNRLAEEYDFSGGEIENVVRKITVENILSGKEISYDMVCEFSNSEKLNNSNSHSKVGFV